MAPARDALTLLAQFGIEYLETLNSRPATRQAVLVQMQDAVRIIEAALPKEGNTDGGHPSQ